MATKKKSSSGSYDPNTDPAVIAFRQAMAGGAPIGSNVLDASNFQTLQGQYGGIWNEAGYVEQDNANPLYVSGDEWKQLPVGSDLADLQHHLISAGFMSADNIVFGSPDSKTASAMADLLASSNSQGVVWQTALARRLAQAAGQPADQGPHRAPLVVRLTNPDDIKAVIQSGANEVFGKYLDPGEVDKFVSAYQSQQAAYQTAAYQASGYNPETGQQDLTSTGQPTAQGITLTAPATGEGEQRQFFDQMAAAHPVDTSTAVFTDKFRKIVEDLRGEPIGIRP